MKKLIDVHTHTVMSGHAYSTLNEMLKVAQEKNLCVYGVAEHGPAMDGAPTEIYFKNYNVIPRKYGNLRLLMGVELNILDEKGTLDLPEKVLKLIDFRIAGIHSCFKKGNKEQNTSAIINAMKNPYVNIISHPVDGTAEVNIRKIVEASKEYGTILELNNSSLQPRRKKPLAYQNFKEMLGYCKELEVPILVGSDAHIDVDVANFDMAEKLIDEIGFPETLILNDKPKEFLKSINLLFED